jgi:hypothetical protein
VKQISLDYTGSSANVLVTVENAGWEWTAQNRDEFYQVGAECSDCIGNWMMDRNLFNVETDRIEYYTSPYGYKGEEHSLDGSGLQNDLDLG